MSPLLKIFDDFLKFGCQTLHTLKVVFGQRLKLLDVAEDVDQLLKSPDESVELAEELGFGEVECFAFGHICNFFLGFLVAISILPVELNALAKDIDKFSGVSLPDIFNFAAIEYFFLAVLDHLVGDFDEKSGHFVVGVVEPSNCVDHLDCVHQGRQGVNDLLRSSFVQRL